jgi:hypothetical protein
VSILSCHDIHRITDPEAGPPNGVLSKEEMARGVNIPDGDAKFVDSSVLKIRHKTYVSGM